MTTELERLVDAFHESVSRGYCEDARAALIAYVREIERERDALRALLGSALQDMDDAWRGGHKQNMALRERIVAAIEGKP